MIIMSLKYIKIRVVLWIFHPPQTSLIVNEHYQFVVKEGVFDSDVQGQQHMLILPRKEKHKNTSNALINIVLVAF